MRKQFLSILLVLCLALTLVPFSVFADEPVASGSCGSDLRWSLDSSGVMTIIGNGAMGDYLYLPTPPWSSIKGSVKSVVFTSGVERIGAGAFWGCGNITSVVIPTSVTEIGVLSFHNCHDIRDVYYSGSEDQWNEIDIDEIQNQELLNAVIHYNSESSSPNPDYGSVQKAVDVSFSLNYPELMQQYKVNQPEINDNAIEYGWYVEFTDGTNRFRVATAHWKQPNSSPATMSLYDMQTNLWFWDESSFKLVNNCELKINGTELTWNATIPAKYNFNANTVSVVLEKVIIAGKTVFTSEPGGTPIVSETEIPFNYSISETTTMGSWHLPYADSFLLGNANQYNHDLAKISLGLTMASSNLKMGGNQTGAQFIRAMLEKMGFDKQTFQESESYEDTQGLNDKCEYIFAAKKLASSDDYVVCVVIRSNGYGAEWVSNAHVNNGKDLRFSAGFKGAADGVYNALEKYIEDSPVDKSHIKLWVSGFSRGGAVANLLGARLTEEIGIDPGRIFVYGFAVPRTVQKNTAKPYENIFNIINQCDLVPRVPLKAWGYERYGVDKFLPCISKNALRYRSVRSNMEDYFDIMMDNSGLPTEYSLVSAQERTLDILLAYLSDIFPTAQSYRNDGYQAAVMEACRVWQVNGVEFKPEYLLEQVFGIPQPCGKAMMQIFEKWKDQSSSERLSSIIAVESLLNDWADQNGSAQAQKVRNMFLDFLGHIALYISMDFLPLSAASTYSMSKSMQYVELVSLIYNQISKAKEHRAFASSLLMQHWPETYLSWMMAGDEKTVYSNGSYTMLFVKCPVDITVYDENEKIAARITNDIIDESIQGLYCETDCFNEKMILIPDDKAYHTVITAREKGSVDIVEQKRNVDDEVIDTNCYIQLPMEKDQLFSVSVGNTCDITTNGRILVPDKSYTEDNKTVMISAIAQEGGLAIGAKDYQLGDTVELIAMPDEQYSFSGWYEGDTLLSHEEILHFSAISNRILTAKFEKAEAIPTDEPTAQPTPAPPAPSNPFADVKQGQYYYDPVLWAVNRKPQITNGTSAATFSPNVTCTRGQVVTFLWRAAGEPKPSSANNSFTDVKSNAYYYNAVLWAVEKGITNGTSATTFSPNDPCTRAHVVTFLWRSQGNENAGSSNPFKDVPSGKYYTTAVFWAVNHQPQITKGTSATTFSPSAPCTRGQIVTFLYRCMGQANNN